MLQVIQQVNCLIKSVNYLSVLQPTYLTVQGLLEHSIIQINSICKIWLSLLEWNHFCTSWGAAAKQCWYISLCRALSEFSVQLHTSVLFGKILIVWCVMCCSWLMQTRTCTRTFRLWYQSGGRTRWRRQCLRQSTKRPTSLSTNVKLSKSRGLTAMKKVCIVILFADL